MSVTEDADEDPTGESTEREADLPAGIAGGAWSGRILDLLHDSARVERVFGDPIEADGRTVVPVARVAYGFGGGYGSGTAEASPDAEGVGRAGDGREDEDERPEGGSGAGGGGGVAARPVGAIEVSGEGTRLLRFDDRRRRLGVLLLGIALGVLLGRRR